MRFDGASRASYSTDASNYRQVPIGVVIGPLSAILFFAIESSSGCGRVVPCSFTASAPARAEDQEREDRQEDQDFHETPGMMICRQMIHFDIPSVPNDLHRLLACFLTSST